MKYAMPPGAVLDGYSDGFVYLHAVQSPRRINLLVILVSVHTVCRTVSLCPIIYEPVSGINSCEIPQTAFTARTHQIRDINGPGPGINFTLYGEQKTLVSG